ncbi:DUF4136 domain-containing protein [Thalassotalea ponticola]|uniref:DUF4136 domain-containing protein n=1 Tax=Thalassotalea ponticola TaxID=1523392 RepID=UPI0025B2E36A|nr:DUF4136 domain-containing protein [Thalassotalea ponticola]MDN3653349.1 DUF4136 domain-containing protein [Thalassotalea ponticola]
MSNYNFNRVDSYSLFARDSKFTGLQSLSDYQRNRIELAIERKMERLGYQYDSLAQADIVVSYFLVGSSLAELENYNRFVRACLGCSEQQQQQLNKAIRSSMLIVDVLDGERKRSVYRGYTHVDLDIEHNSDENQQQIIDAVDQILGQLGLNTVQ